MPDIATLGIAVDAGPVNAASAALNKLAQSAAPATAAINNLQSASATSAKSAASMAAAAQQVASASALQTQALNVSAAAHGAHGRAANNNSIAMLELMHVSRSLTEQISMGVDPLRALTMEFGRIMTLLQYGGGPSGVLSLFGSMLSKLLNPVVLVGGALAGLGAIGALAFAGWESHLEKLQAALGGIGRQTGLTLDALNRVAIMGAQAGNISISSAQNLTAQFAATGKIGPSMIGQLLDTAKQFATGTGQSLDDAGKELANAFADPIKGATDLNAKLGLLDDATLEQIRTFTASGQVLAAQGVLLRSLQNDITAASDRTWTWTKIWEGLGKEASVALAITGRAITSTLDPTLLERYTKALAQAQQAANLGSYTPLGASPNFQQNRVSAAQTLADDLNEQLRRQNALASQQGATVATNLQSISSAKIITSINTEIQAYRDLTDRLAELSGVSAEAVTKMAGGIDVYGHIVTGAQLYAQTVDQVTQAHNTFLTSFQREISSGQLEIESIAARTLAEKAAIAVGRERLSLAGQQITADQAQILVDQKLAQVLAEANRQVADNSRQVANSAATAGLSGYQLQLAQLDQKYKQLTEDAGTFRTITMQVPAPPPTALAAPAGAVSAAQSEAARLGAGGSFPAGALGASAGGPASAFGDLSKAIGGVGSAAAGAAPAMMTITKTIEGGGNAAQLAKDKLQEQASIIKNATQPAIDSANKSIGEQIAMLGVQESTFGKSTGAIAEAAEAQQLLNQFTREGIPISDSLRAQIDKTASKYGQAATAAENFRMKSELVISTMDGLRTASTDALSTFTTDVMNGMSAIDSLNAALKNVINDILQVEEKNLVTSLLGASGSSQGGAVGGGILSALKSAFGMAGGGRVFGPGGPTSDTIPAMLSPGEFVINADATSRHFALLNAINSGTIRHMASGGPVGRGIPTSDAMPTNVRLSVTTDKDRDVKVTDVRRDRDTLDIELMVEKTVANSISRSGSRVSRALNVTYGSRPAVTRR